MSFLLPWYDKEWRDKILTAHAKRGYTHFHLDRKNCQDAGLNDEETVALVKYVQSWGFYVSMWIFGQGLPANSNWNGVKYGVEPFLNLIIQKDAGEKFICVLGGELDEWNRGGPDYLDDIIRGVCSICNPADIPCWLHFTMNKPAWQLDGTDATSWWKQFQRPAGQVVNGVKQLGRLTGLAWQANHHDPTGTLSAHLWDARRYIGAASLDFKVSAWELRAMAQLYGECDEGHGQLTGWETVCAPPGPQLPDAPPVAGSMGGILFPDGRPILMP